MVELRREALLLTRSFRETREGLRLSLWGASEMGPVCVTLNEIRSVFFVDRSTKTLSGERRAVKLKDLRQRPVDAVYFRSQRELNGEKQRLAALGLAVFEADVKPVDRS